VEVIKVVLVVANKEKKKGGVEGKTKSDESIA
jgi:hypothetical protein